MHDTSSHDRQTQKHGVRNLLLMAVFSFLSMYTLMYMMVDVRQNVHPNVNQFYMAGLMTAPMLIFEMALMGAMYGDRRFKTAVVAGSLVLLVVFAFFVRRQVGVTDRQFLRSMIPHHGAAVLMCKRAHIQDAEIRELCASIISSQQSEIDWMQAKLAELD